jgi:hypothetical protein
MTTKYALLINITSFKTYNYNTEKYICDSLIDCKNKLIITFKNELNKFNFDYPINFDEYQDNLYHYYYHTSNILIEYYIFDNEKLIMPWSIQELYELATDIINKLDIQKVLLNKYEDIKNGEENDEEYDYNYDNDNENDEYKI